MNGVRVQFVTLLVLCVTLPCGVVLSTHLARRSFERVRLRDQTVTVKGYAERAIVSDTAKWSATVTARGATLKEANAELERGRGKLLGYLKDGGFADGAVWRSPVGISALAKRDAEGKETNAIEFHVLRQSFVLTSTEVGRIAATAVGASDLLRDGVQLEADAPTYLYTKLDDAKLEMIGEAVANARARAEALVKGSGSSLGGLRSATQGVFQITPRHSTDVSGEGVYDVRSIEKMLKAVVTQEFAID